MSWIRLPPDLLLSGPQRKVLSQFASLEVRSEPDGGMRVTTSEDYRRSGKPGIASMLVARGQVFEQTGLQRLLAPPLLAQTIPEQELQSMRLQRRAFVRMQEEPQPRWARFVGEVQLAPEEDLPSLLADIQADGAPEDSIWVFEADRVLSQRLALMRALFAARHAHEAWKLHDGFPAGRALMMNSTAGFTIFLEPPLLYRAPWSWGNMVMRAHRTVARLLGAPLFSPRSWGGPLDTLKGSMYEAPTIPDPPHQPVESLADREEFLLWWVDRVSTLIHILSDLTLYRDEHGEYRPERHFSTVLTVERLFVSALELMRLRTVSELLRKHLLFDLLDILHGHDLGDHEKNLQYTKQLAAWHEVESRLSPGVQRCIAPLVNGAFEALRGVEDGIWAASRRQGDKLLIDRKAGLGQDAIAIDRARGEYLHILRNSHHGFRDMVKNKRDLSYLATFTGELSNRLPDLAWWYLVRLLDDPTVLIGQSVVQGSR